MSSIPDRPLKPSLPSAADPTCASACMSHAEITTAITAILDRLPDVRLDPDHETPRIIGMYKNERRRRSPSCWVVAAEVDITMTSTTDLAVPHVIRGELRVPAGNRVHRNTTGSRRPRSISTSWCGRGRSPGPRSTSRCARSSTSSSSSATRLDLDTNEHMQAALEASIAVNPLGPRILEPRTVARRRLRTRCSMWFQVEQEVGREPRRLGGGHRTSTGGSGECARSRPRLIHVLAGNTPGVTAITIARALTKGVHLLKLPSNDLFTGTAILRTLEEIAPDHPVTQSFSCVYWRGGDASVSRGVLFRAQFFDKLVAWGGDAAIRSVLGYIAPGFELVSFDPKVSISLLGREALASEATRCGSRRPAAAIDASLFNQEVCAASRFVYAEGDRDELRPWCALLVEELGVDARSSDAVVRRCCHGHQGRGRRPPGDGADIRGVRADDGSRVSSCSPTSPSTSTPQAKTVNVVPRPDSRGRAPARQRRHPDDRHLPGAPGRRAAGQLAARGMQRLVPLGEVTPRRTRLPARRLLPAAPLRPVARRRLLGARVTLMLTRTFERTKGQTAPATTFFAGTERKSWLRSVPHPRRNPSCVRFRQGTLRAVPQTGSATVRRCHRRDRCQWRWDHISACGTHRGAVRGRRCPMGRPTRWGDRATLRSGALLPGAPTAGCCRRRSIVT